ncbi:hypothetical protein B2J93_7373 [Marssonina coronariae]|uniref:Uncharacterized protein n=1 Tax=Diplocarpon coronariae TaxID=2795749 RepID=A0A218Z7X4_9HELO|nr:hypothetical protein B2J93_7373 [Marssonina coronariae]
MSPFPGTLPISPTQILAGIRDKGTTRRPESGLKVLDASQRMYGEEKGSHSSQNESPAPVTPLPLGHLIALLRPCTRKQGKENQAKQPHPEPGRIPSNSPTIQKSQHSSKQLCLQTLTPGYPQVSNQSRRSTMILESRLASPTRNSTSSFRGNLLLSLCHPGLRWPSPAYS